MSRRFVFFLLGFALSFLSDGPCVAHDSAQAASCKQLKGPLDPGTWLSCCLAKCGEASECASQCHQASTKLQAIRQGETTRDQKLLINLPKLNQGQ